MNVALSRRGTDCEVAALAGAMLAETAGHDDARMALIPTDGGLCGIRWRVLESQSEQSQPFASRPPQALLARIIPPGLNQSQLRKALGGPSAVREVFPGSRNRFHENTVPLWFPELLEYLQDYFGSGLRPSATPGFVDVWTHWQRRLDFGTLTPFQIAVLTRVAAIPRGQVMTYGEVAKSLGRPGAARAVGAALAANPWPVLIPCHRVIGSGGALRGFTAPGGITAKKRMLDAEADTLFAPARTDQFAAHS